MKSRGVMLAGFVAFFAVTFFWARTRGASIDESPPDHVRMTIATAQGDRQWIIYVPASCDKARLTPLVIMLHGFGGTGSSAAKETLWSAKADFESFIIAYPEATRPDKTQPQNFRKNPQAWNDGSGRFHAAAERIDDVAFIDAMIDRIGKDHAIDPDRIFVAGFSNGASMAFRLGAELSHRIAAIAPVAGTSWVDKPKPSGAISICYITGTADTLNPVTGGFPRLAIGGRDQGERAKPPVQAFIDQWATSLECPEQPRADENADGVRKRVYGYGRDTSEIIFVTVEGLGHHWPGGVSQVPRFLVGQASDKLRATDVIWEFFKSHPRTSK
jgi:polyhydroxybutyrate depolymerase